MSDYTLLPCPFCGGEAKLQVSNTDARVLCTACGAMTAWQRRPLLHQLMTEEQMAISIWNIRTHNAYATHAANAQPFSSSDILPEDS